MIGDPIRGDIVRVLTFKAVKKGADTLEIMYAQPWYNPAFSEEFLGKTEVDKSYYKLTINVAPKKTENFLE